MKTLLKTMGRLGLVGAVVFLSASGHADNWERRQYRGDGYYSPPPPRIGDEPRRFNTPEPVVRPLPGPIVGPSLLDREDGRDARERYYRDDRGYIHDRRFRRDPYYGRRYGSDPNFGVPSAPIINQYPDSWMSNGGPPPVGY